MRQVSTTTVIPEYGRARSPKLRRFLWITTKIADVLALMAGLVCGAWWWAVVRPYCLEALRKLTGRDPGRNYQDWAPPLDSLPTSRPS